MNIAISEACKQTSDTKKDKIEIRPAIPFIPESTVESDRTDKNKDEFISVTCRYRPSAGDSKKNNYVIQAKHFETGTTEDVLHWYITLQKFLKRNPVKMQRLNLAWWSYYLEAKVKKLHEIQEGCDRRLSSF